MIPLIRLSSSACRRLFLVSSRSAHYVQGDYIQVTQGKLIRQYFYYIDHHGMLFLDDARMKNFTSCFKEEKFLRFFYRRLELNNTGLYAEFPYISLCGPERNYVRCDDLPIVYIKLVVDDTHTEATPYLCYGNTKESLKVEFHPNKVSMEVETGRVYYPAMKKLGGVGLICSKLAIELSSMFQYDDGPDNSPSHINWNGNLIKLTHEVLPLLDKLKDVRKYSLGLDSL